MFLTYLVANQAWVITFGDQIIDLDGQRFFETRRFAEIELGNRRLRVLPSGQIVARCATIGCGRPSTGTIVYRETSAEGDGAEHETHERVCTSCGFGYPGATWLGLGPITWISDRFCGDVVMGARND